MSCCRAHATHSVPDSQFADDDFTKVALCEHHTQTAHKRTLAVGLSVIGGLLLFWAAKRHGCRGGCSAA